MIASHACRKQLVLSWFRPEVDQESILYYYYLQIELLRADANVP